MRKHIPGFVLASAVALSVCLVAPCHAQSSDSRGLFGKLSEKRRAEQARAEQLRADQARAKQQAVAAQTPVATPSVTPAPATPTPPPASAPVATSSGSSGKPAVPPKLEDEVKNAAADFFNSNEGKETIKKAQEALAGKSEDDILAKAQSLMKDPKTVDAMVEKGSALAATKGLPGVPTDELKSLIQKTTPDQIKEAAKQLQPLQPVSGQIMKQAGAFHATKVADVEPSEVPAPVDPKKIVIPRPVFDPKKMTKITSDKSEFNANSNEVKFEGNVTLDHPEFDLSCDVLVAYLKDKPAAEAAGANPAAAAAAGGIERAVATGFVVIERASPDGKFQVAHSRSAVYEASSGEVTLTDFPQLQDGANLIRGTSETTKIILRPNGTHNVSGPAEYLVASSSNALPGLNRSR